MIIECPACHTRYRTDDSLTVTETTLFECSREQCGHVFPYFPESPKTAEPVSPLAEAPPVYAARAPGGASLPLVPSDEDEFEPLPNRAAFLDTDEVSAPDVPPPRSASPSLHTPPTRASRPAKPLDEDIIDEEPFTFDDAPDLPPVAAPPVRAPAMENRPSAPPPKRPSTSRPRQPSFAVTTLSVWPVLGLLVLLVLGYALLGSRWRSNLANTEERLARLPIVGSSFAASQFSPQHIVLSDLKSGFWVTKDSKRVFAISGKATNTAPVPASMVQIEGQLHDIDGKIIEQRTISCGMGTTADSLPTLTTREINVLQGLVPPKQFHIPSGQSVGFLIVFPDPPTTVTELSCHVATAQFGAF